MNYNKQIKHPPTVNTKGFDKEALEVIASQKIKELKKKNLYSDSVRKKEDLAYYLLLNNEEYSYSWFKAKVYLYELETEREEQNLWLRYWKKIGGFEKKINKDLDVESARNFPIKNLIGDFRKVGGRICSKCPFHNPGGEREKSQSFFVYPDNSYHCFSCGEHGLNAIDFLMARDNLEFMDAVKQLV